MDDFDTTKQLRASVATYNQVIFPHPEDGVMMLALERKAAAALAARTRKRRAAARKAVATRQANMSREQVSGRSSPGV